MMFLRCVGEALVVRGMRGLLELVPYGGLPPCDCDRATLGPASPGNGTAGLLSSAGSEVPLVPDPEGP
jgi:hypothetical protein